MTSPRRRITAIGLEEKGGAMIGAAGAAVVQSGRFLDFAARALWAVPGACWRRPGSVARQFERAAWGTLPIALAAGASVGLVTWLQTRRLLVTYGVESTLPSVLGAAVLAETGPVLAGLLVAGRMGAGLAAELGTMALTEEIEAREVLGAPPIPTLVAPRVAACAAALPALTVVLDGAALLGGLVAEQVGGSSSPAAFVRAAFDFIHLADVVPATLKTAAFGALVGLVGSWTGLRAGRSAESVGRAATRGVVRSMLAVFAADVVLVPTIQAAVEALTPGR